jgi:hypothetical protein
MLVGINQGESATTQLRRDKLAEMEMQYRQGQMNAQRQAAMAAMAKQQADMEAAKQAAMLRGNIGNILSASDPRGVMGSLAPTTGNAQMMDSLAQNPEDLLRAKYERAIQMAALGGDKDVSGSMLALLKELNPTYGLSPNIGVEGGKPYAYVTSNQGKSKRLSETPPDKIKFMDLGNQEAAVSEYAVTPGMTFKKGVSPDTSARIADSQAGRAQSERHWGAQTVEVPGTMISPGYGPGNVQMTRKELEKRGIRAFASPDKKATTADKSSGAYGRAADDARGIWTAKYKSAMGVDPRAPDLEKFIEDYVATNGAKYGMEGPKADAAVVKPAKKVVRTGTKKDGTRVVQYEDGTIEELK